MSEGTALEVRELTVEYGSRRSLRSTLARVKPRGVCAVDDVSFDVVRGTLLALVGASGSGKTTCGLALMGLVRPVSGAVIHEGRAVHELEGRALQRYRGRVQMIWQDPYGSLDPRLRVCETVEESLEIHSPELGKDERRERARAALANVGLAPDVYMTRYPHQLSGGQRQRVATAAVLVLEPEVIVADEPVSMLDVSVRAGVLQLFRGLADAGIAIVMITHDIPSVGRYADEVIVMSDGRIVERGPAARVIHAPTDAYTRRLLDAVPRLDHAAARPAP